MAYPQRDPQAERARLIRLIHIAKAQLQLDEDVYRDILRSKAKGKDSSTELTVLELDAVLEHMKRGGFKVKGAPQKAPRTARTRRMADDPEAKKIRALWLLLRDLGVLKNASEEALAAYVKRMTKVDDLHWINGHQAETVIESLKKWAMRFLPAAVEAKAAIAEKSDIHPDHKVDIQIRLREAKIRGSFEPMLALWEGVDAILERSRNG